MKVDYDSNTPLDLEWMKFNLNFKWDEQKIKGSHVIWGTLILKPYISSLVKKMIPKLQRIKLICEVCLKGKQTMKKFP
jgi:hypothetical protein